MHRADLGGHQLLLVVAAGGYGKTTALRRLFPGPGTAWFTGPDIDVLANDGIDGLVAGADRPSWIVVDDVPRLSTARAGAVLEQAARLPDGVVLALSSRWPLPAAVSRWRGRGLLTEVGPAQLRVGAQTVRELLPPSDDLTGGWDERLRAQELHRLTGGWPALVHLATEALRRDDGDPRGGTGTTLPEPMGVGADPFDHGGLLRLLTRAGSPLHAYVRDEILGRLPGALRRLVADLAEFTPAPVALCEELGHRRVAELMALLVRIGLAGPVATGDPDPAHLDPVHLDPQPHRGSVADLPDPARHHHDEVRLIPVIAAVAALDGARPHARAARWYDRHGPPVAAARAFAQAGDQQSCARVLRAHGAAMLGAGAARTVAELAAGLPGRPPDQSLRLLHGDALRTAGDIAQAHRLYRLAAGLSTVDDEDAAWPPGVAWRMGLVHYLRGEPAEALRAFARAAPGSATDPANAAPDRVLLLAWQAATHLLLSQEEVAIAHARQAVTLAAGLLDHARADTAPADAAPEAVDADAAERAAATAHTTMGVCLSLAGLPAASEQHYATALGIAERLGDLLLISRVHINRAHHLLTAARYPDALAAATRAATAARAAGHANLWSIARYDRAQALARLGRDDEAIDEFTRVRAVAARMGSRHGAAALLGIGEVHRRRGWHRQAVAAYQEAAGLSRASGDTEVLVEALAGLARVTAADDPAAAAAHAREASEHAGGRVRPPALLAQGWAAAHGGDRARAAGHAAQAIQVAAEVRDRAWLAEALELRAGTECSVALARSTYVEAYGIWRDGGAQRDADRVLVALGRLPGASTEHRLAALRAAQRLHQADAGALLTPVEQPAVTIRALGRFEVRVGDRAVPASEWQSRKARDLLRVLVARRGRPVPRGELSELLWPDDDPTRTGHRLSVLLSIVRSVLGPGAEAAIVADQSGVALDTTLVRVDVEVFLTDVGHALRLHERGALAEARALLAVAQNEYVGDAFEDDPYAEWAGPLREEVRAAYLRAVRLLAELSRRAGAVEDSIGHLLAILRHDPYDEVAHRSLVRTLVEGGRHGEARRAFDRYRRSMVEIGVRPPAADLLTAGRT